MRARRVSGPNRVVTAGVAFAAVVLGTAAPVHADTVSFADKRGDAIARYDLTKVSVWNGTDMVVARARVRNLRTQGTQVVGLSIEPVGLDVSYMAYSVRRADGEVRNRLMAYGPDGTSRAGCMVVAVWRPRKDTVRVVVPHDCLPDGKIRARVLIGPGDATAGDPADWTKTVGVRQD